MSISPIDQRLHALTVPSQKTEAERMVDRMRELHRRIGVEVAGDEDKAPVWCAHLPSGELMPIHFIGTWGPFVRLTGFGVHDDECDYALIAPEQLVVTIRSVPPDSDEPRRPIGFGDWLGENDDMGDSEGDGAA